MVNIHNWLNISFYFFYLLYFLNLCETVKCDKYYGMKEVFENELLVFYNFRVFYFYIIIRVH